MCRRSPLPTAWTPRSLASTSDGNGLPNFFGTSAAAPDAAAVAALALQAAGGPGSVRPHGLYRLLQDTATPIPTPNDRRASFADLGPIKFSAQGDWTRWENYFGLALEGRGYAVKSVAFDLADTGLVWSRIQIASTSAIRTAWRWPTSRALLAAI